MKKRTFWMLGITQVVLAAPAQADDLPKLAERRVLAMQVGLEGRTLQSVTRLPGPGREPVKQRLIASLEHTLGRVAVQAGDAVSEEKAELSLVRSASGRRWFLQVRGDGTAASFVDEDAMQRGRAFATSKEGRIGAAELERRGRAFIATTLREQIVLGTGESLEALATRYMVEDSVRIRGEKYTSEDAPRVVASRVVFGRSLDGTPVLGRGSWISVSFTNDGTPVEFEYDWPTYSRATATRTALGLDAILVRAGSLSQVSLAAPGISVRSMECGYHDSTSPGAALQPACSVDYSHRLESGEVAMYSDVIPAAEQVEEDSRWRESREVRNVAARSAARSISANGLRSLFRESLGRLQLKKK
jgi:hypothetical protein